VGEAVLESGRESKRRKSRVERMLYGQGTPDVKGKAESLKRQERKKKRSSGAARSDGVKFDLGYT